MHPEAYDWVRQAVAYDVRDAAIVIELGSRDVNGSCRDLFPLSDYIGVDIVDGPGVDVVCDAADYLHDVRVDVVVTTEMLEHCPRSAEVIAASARLLRPGGVLILTAAGPGRGEHSAVDGGPIRPGEHYANIDPGDLETWLTDAGFDSWTIDVQRHPADVRAVARR